jgi:RNA-binding protein
LGRSTPPPANDSLRLFLQSERFAISDFEFPSGVMYGPGMELLTNAQIRELKARAQRMKATIKVGKDGLSPRFIGALDEALKHNELLKVKFEDFKDQKKALAPELADKTHSHLITRVGNVVVLYRPKPPEADEVAD